ncbi:MAG: LD-carboxypeptidase [Bacteroidales bacterium]|jgi:muramoyltetrapeptide carboxypeptidase|nr:LD-carboxypeptidase [Bacteroidales bacterium]
MITPSKLKPGDTIGIVAPARKIEPREIEGAKQVFEKWGLKVLPGKHIFKQNHQFAGTDRERAMDIQEMMDHPEVKAIICARGGYGTIRTLSYLNFSSFIKNPKWIIGYSDITALHARIHQLGIQSIHGLMPINFPSDGSENEATQTLKNILFGDKNVYPDTVHPFNKTGKGKGQFIGGNLSVIYSLSGTKYDFDTQNKILFLEDLDEYLYHIDRMMMNLKLSGKLDNLQGMVVGGMTGMNDHPDSFGKSAYEIIRDLVSEYSFPVCYQFPAGHIPINLALVMGANAELEVTAQGACFRLD